MACSGCSHDKDRQPPPPKSAPPSLSRKVLSAMTAAAKFALGGMRVVSLEDQAARMSVCEGCPMKRGDQCTACGCVLSIKSWMPAEHCPHKLWPPLKG